MSRRRVAPAVVEAEPESNRRPAYRLRATDPAQRREPLERAAFYCLADERYFPGAAALVNSLRLVGHREPIHLLDCGLTSAQRELLAGEVNFVAGPGDEPPYMLKTRAPLECPATVMVLIDCDMVATRSLADLIDTAAQGRVVAFDNEMNRSIPEWGPLLDLGEVRRQPSVGPGLVILGGKEGRETLELWDDRQDRVDFELGWFRRRVPDYPFLFMEEDVLNGVLATRLEADRLLVLDHRLAPVPPYSGLEVEDVTTLRCAYPDGTQPYVVHQYRCKPWLEPAYDGVYARLFRRLLAGADVPVKVPRRDLPLRVRSGHLADLERLRINAREQLRWRLGRRDRVGIPGDAWEPTGSLPGR